VKIVVRELNDDGSNRSVFSHRAKVALLCKIEEM
jgi:hypothetical protein